MIDYSDSKEIGRAGEKVSAIGLGTWAIRDYSKAYDVFIYGLTHGIDNIDTAEMYDDGKAEMFVAKVIKNVGRENVFITTKIMPDKLIDSDRVLKAAEASLKRLEVSNVDLMLIHWPNYSMSIEDQVRNFEIVYLKGLARYIGVSNFDREMLEKAMQSTRRAELVVDQVQYSVLNKSVEKELLPFAIEKHVTIQAYTPIERGRVRDHPVIKEVSRKYGKTEIQVALNYLISHPRVVALVKTENIIHLKEILGSLGWRLGEQDMTLLKKI